MGGEVLGPCLVAHLGKAVARPFVVAVEWVAFWAAIALPFLYGSGLFLYGSELVWSKTLYGLVFLNLVALVVGHRHKNRRTYPQLYRPLPKGQTCFEPEFSSD